MAMRSTVFVILAIAILGVDMLPQIQNVKLERKDFIKELCKKNGAEDKYQDIKDAADQVKECVSGHIDTDALKKQFREAFTNNTFNAESFKQLCSKISEVRACVSVFLTSFAPCTDEPMRNYFSAATNTENELMDFICSDDGERISKFISEGGMQCFQGYSLLNCANNYMAVMSRNMNSFIFSAPELCTNLSQLHSCMSPQLGMCKTVTASDLFDSFVSITRKNFSCNS